MKSIECIIQNIEYLINNKRYKLFTEKVVPLLSKEFIPGDIPLHQMLIADPAYPILPHVVKEYCSCSENKHVIYNQMLRSVRNMIECAFGRLKNRFRILQKPIDLDICFTPTLIHSCFVLHNFCEKEKVEVPVDHEGNHGLTADNKIDKIYSSSSSQGIKVRDTIADYFAEYL